VPMIIASTITEVSVICYPKIINLPGICIF